MWEFLATPAAKAVISAATLAAVLVVGYYIVRRFRDRIDDDAQVVDIALMNFRESHHEGHITDGEFRDIKTMMGAELQRRTNDDDKTD